MNKDKMIIVKWVDSLRDSNWNDRASHARHRASECISIGFLLVDNEDDLIIYQSDDFDNGSVGCSLTIPKKAIQEVIELRKK
jgi:hypothetical protein